MPTVKQVAGDGGVGEEQVEVVGVLLECCWNISSSMVELPGGEVAARAAAVEGHTGTRGEDRSG